jgi:hypothetical protein
LNCFSTGNVVNRASAFCILDNKLFNFSTKSGIKGAFYENLRQNLACIADKSLEEVRSSERARRVKILEETGAQGVQAAVLGLRGGASEVEAVLTLVRGVRAL